MRTALNVHVDEQIIKDDPQCYCLKDFFEYLISIKILLRSVYGTRIPRIDDIWYDNTSNTIKAEIYVEKPNFSPNCEGDSNE